MEVLFFVLNKVEKLNDLLNELEAKHIPGATIINSTGMAHALYDSDDHHAFASFRHFLDPSRKSNKTLMMVINKEEKEVILECIQKIVGDIDDHDTGIVFTVPVDFVRGTRL